MLTILLTIALDTAPVKPLPVLLPRPVQSQTAKPKQNDKDKNRKTGNAYRRILGGYLAFVAAR